MTTEEHDKIADYMFERLQEAIENEDEVEALGIERHLFQFGFKDEAIEALDIIKQNFKHE